MWSVLPVVSVVSAVNVLSVENAATVVSVVIVETVATVVSAVSVLSVASTVSTSRRRSPLRIPLRRTSATPSTTWTFNKFVYIFVYSLWFIVYR